MLNSIFQKKKILIFISNICFQDSIKNIEKKLPREDYEYFNSKLSFKYMFAFLLYRFRGIFFRAYFLYSSKVALNFYGHLNKKQFYTICVFVCPCVRVYEACT